MEGKKNVSSLAAMFEKKANNKDEPRKSGVGKLQTPAVFGAKKEEPRPVKKEDPKPKDEEKVEAGNVKSLTAMFERKSTVKLDQDKQKFLSK